MIRKKGLLFIFTFCTLCLTLFVGSRSAYAEQTFSSPEEAMDYFDSSIPKSRAWMETVPNIADQVHYGGNTWSSLLNVQYRTLNVRNGYDRSFTERKPSSWGFGKRTYYWQFSYRVY